MPYQVNGSAVELPGPVVTDGTTFVPCADLANALGGYAEWMHEAKTARIEIGDKVGFIKSGEGNAVVNGERFDLKADTYIDNDTLWVPVRMFRDAYGLKLDIAGDNVIIDRF